MNPEDSRATAERHNDDVDQPRSADEGQGQIEHSVDQHLQGNRPDGSVEAVASLKPPIAGHEQLQSEMPQVIVRVDEKGTVGPAVDELQQRDQQECCEMQWIQPRKSEHEKFAASDSPVGNRVAVLPKENETADAPEYAHPFEAMLVQKRENRIHRLTRPDEIRRLRDAPEYEMLIVKDEHGEGRHEAEQFESEQFVVVGRRIDTDPLRRRCR